ncbi:hypothetical protein BSU04_25705 [Caballeronia sordidicola]|jgi:hypothetical protein|uniref:Uncharacterized protein n=1 Tax=Caballeronia sordidicola TaxID=196367 RepID=A0A226WYD8_CABSO|nr:hypothetical protein BSU04_25705 [Caballeronia sordidicola]
MHGRLLALSVVPRNLPFAAANSSDADSANFCAILLTSALHRAPFRPAKDESKRVFRQVNHPLSLIH